MPPDSLSAPHSQGSKCDCGVSLTHTLRINMRKMHVMEGGIRRSWEERGRRNLFLHGANAHGFAELYFHSFWEKGKTFFVLGQNCIRSRAFFWNLERPSPEERPSPKQISKTDCTVYPSQFSKASLLVLWRRGGGSFQVHCACENDFQKSQHR